MPEEAAVTIVMRMRDEASAEFEKFGTKTQKTKMNLQAVGMQVGIFGAMLTGMAVLAARAADANGELGTKVAEVRKELSALSQTMGRAILPVLLIFLDVIRSLFEFLGKLPEPLLRTLGVMTLLGGGFLSAAGAAFLFASSLEKLAPLLGFTAALTQGPAGLLKIGLGIAAFTGISALLASYQYGGTVPGPIGSPRLAVVHGGETITPPGRAGVTINIGNYYGDDRSRRELARDIHRIIREENRTGAVGRLA